jgi:hypothetical protein
MTCKYDPYSEQCEKCSVFVCLFLKNETFDECVDREDRQDKRHNNQQD